MSSRINEIDGLKIFDKNTVSFFYMKSTFRNVSPDNRYFYWWVFCLFFVFV